MNEVVIVTSSKDLGGGIAILDLATCAPICSNFKNCIADPGAICLLGNGSSSFSGSGSSGDYVAVAQSKKTSINIYQWGKPQALYQCHVQEITSALASDRMGRYLCAGSKKGWCSFWELSTGLLLHSFQAHFKAVTKVEFTACGGYCVTVSEDGMARVWEVAQIVDQSEIVGRVGASVSVSSRRSIIPYRSWSPHTLSAKDLHLVCAVSSLRVFSCSTDRTVVMYDVHSGKQVLRVSLPAALECITVSPMQDLCFAGASNGSIYVIDLSVTAIALSAARAAVGHVKKQGDMNTTRLSNDPLKAPGVLGGLPAGVSVMEGHTRAVNHISCSLDNTTMVSGSEDGSLRVWDIWTKQCIKEVKPMNKTAVTNVLIAVRPDLIGSSVFKPTLSPLEPLRKYPGNSNLSATAATNGSTTSSRVVLGSGILGSRVQAKLCVEMISQGPDATIGRKASSSSSTAAHTQDTQKSVKRSRDSMEGAGAAEDEEDRVEDEQPALKKMEMGDFVAMPDVEDDGYMGFDRAALPSNLKGIGANRKSLEKGKKAKDQADGISSKRSMAEMEDELKVMKGDNEKWKNMCKAMEAKIIANNGEECEEEEEEVEEDEEDEEEEEEEEEEIVVVDKKGKKSIPATASKSSSSASSSVSAPADQKSKGSSKGDVKVKEQEKEKERKVPVMKDRKKPKDIKENPPSRGKNLTSKDKASSKKIKQKGKK